MKVTFYTQQGLSIWPNNAHKKQNIIKFVFDKICKLKSQWKQPASLTLPSRSPLVTKQLQTLMLEKAVITVCQTWKTTPIRPTFSLSYYS